MERHIYVVKMSNYVKDDTRAKEQFSNVQIITVACLLTVY